MAVTMSYLREVGAVEPTATRNGWLISSLPQRQERKPVHIPAAIWLADRRLTLPCRVLNVSGNGAGVALSDPGAHTATADLPENIVLLFCPDRVEIKAAVRWRTIERFGVRFTSFFVPTSYTVDA